MPALSELADLHALTDASRNAAPLAIPVDAEAEAAMNDTLDRTGLLLLGEIHGIRQTPRVIAALIELLAVRTLALEWPAQLVSTVDAYRRTWAMPPGVPGESPWTARDQAMARRILTHTSPVGRTLVVAGNAHTPTIRTKNGIPTGAWLAQERPGLRSVRINYGTGATYNLASKTLVSSERLTSYRVRLDGDRLLLDHPGPEEADVPHRPDLPGVDLGGDSWSGS